MLKLFNTYKIYILVVVFGIYSFGLWNVASTYTESKYLNKQLDVAQVIIETTTKNEDIKNSIDQILSDKIGAIKSQTTVINRTIQNEILKDTVYIDCKSNPSVMREYQNKLNLQPK